MGDEGDPTVGAALAPPPERGRDPEADAALDRIVLDGAPRLLRTAPVTVVTGIVAGMEVGLGVLALLYVEHDTGSQALAAVAFSVGFIALLLGRSELFTEGFLTPIAVVAARRAPIRDAFKLWSGILVGNLAGGMVIAWFSMRGFPQLQSQARRSAAFFVRDGWSMRTFALAVLAGMAITLMTRMHNGTDSMPVKIVASIAIAFLLAGLRLFHSILDSLLVFFALQSGRAPFGYLDWLRFFSIAVVGNVVGGVGFTTMLRLLQSRRRILEHRVVAEFQAESPAHGDGDAEGRANALVAALVGEQAPSAGRRGSEGSASSSACALPDYRRGDDRGGGDRG